MDLKESDLLGRMRSKVEKISGKTQDITSLDRHEAENFSDKEILEEINEDENAVEHFQRNLENLDNEIDQIINSSVTLDEEEKEKLWKEIMTLSEEALSLAERYSQLPQDIGKLALKSNDADTASTSLTYFVHLGGVLELVGELCEMEARESVLDEIQGISRPQDRLREEENKLKKEKNKLELVERQMEKKFRQEGLIS